MQNNYQQNQQPNGPQSNWEGQQAPYGAQQHPYGQQGWPPQQRGIGAGAIVGIVLGALVLVGAALAGVGYVVSKQMEQTFAAEEARENAEHFSKEANFVGLKDGFGIHFSSRPQHNTQDTSPDCEHTCPYDYDYYRQGYRHTYDVIRYAIPTHEQARLSQPDKARSELKRYMNLNARGAPISNVNEVSVDGAVAALAYRIGPEDGYNLDDEYFDGLYTHILGVWTKAGYYEVIVYSFVGAPRRFEDYFESFVLYGDHAQPHQAPFVPALR